MKESSPILIALKKEQNSTSLPDPAGENRIGQQDMPIPGNPNRMKAQNMVTIATLHGRRRGMHKGNQTSAKALRSLSKLQFFSYICSKHTNESQGPLVGVNDGRAPFLHTSYI